MIFKNKIIQTTNLYSIAFWIVITCGLWLILSSYPMMKLGFDIWDHIRYLRLAVEDPLLIATLPKKQWYLAWASLFRSSGVTDIFTYATVIHRTQFILCCVMVYVAAKQIFSALLPLKSTISDENNWLSSMALSSVLVWLTMIGTFSFFQQAWIMWYSVNYQITLPMLLLSISLCVNLLAIQQPRAQIVFKISMVALLLIGIYAFHAAELAYLVFYFPILILCFGTQYKYKLKYILMALVLGGVIVATAVKLYTGQVPGLVAYLMNGQYSKILADINAKGIYNAVHGGNRYAANWNELYRLSVYMLGFLGVVGLVAWSRMRVPLTDWFKYSQVNKRVFGFILLSLVFCFIPTFKYSSGLASLITYDAIVNRFYFASFAFLAIPLLGYFLCVHTKLLQYPVSIIGVSLWVMLCTFMYSASINNKGVYYNNVKSISKSMLDKKIDMGMSAEAVENIGSQLREAEKKYKKDEFMYCGTYEKLHVAYYNFDKSNLVFVRHGHQTFSGCEEHAKSINKRAVYIH
jgi:hypothetical protein